MFRKRFAALGQGVLRSLVKQFAPRIGDDWAEKPQAFPLDRLLDDVCCGPLEKVPALVNRRDPRRG